MGRLRYVKEGTTQVAEYRYDRIGRLTYSEDENSKVVEYDYNSNSYRTELEYPDGSYISYEYDDAGRVDKIKDDSATPVTLADFDYDDLGRITKVTYANGEYEEFDYEDSSGDDDVGLNIEQVNYSNRYLDPYDYLYDKVGNATDKDYGTSGSYDYGFTYDKIYQLTDTDYPGSADDWEFVYDGVYNRTETTQDTTTRTYTLNGEEMNQYGSITNPSASLTYDDNGNLTDDDTWKYVYDEENRLITIDSQADIEIAAYEYDWAGRLQSTEIRAGTTTYVYDGAHIIAEYQGGSIVRKYIYGPGIDMPIIMITIDGETETPYYYLHDAQGSVVALLNDGGTVVEGYTYGPYGEPSVHSAAGADTIWLTDDDTVAGSPTSYYDNPYMFTARRWDKDIQRYYYRARFYHPDLGRFLQPDPIGYADNMNMYAYCGNNPVNWIDPFGYSLSFRWYGYWGGPGWTGGYWTGEGGQLPDYENMTPAQRALLKKPKDARDECYKRHDLNYADNRTKHGGSSKESEAAFKEQMSKDDLQLADELWDAKLPGFTPLEDLHNGLTVLVFKIKGGLKF